MKLFNSPNNDDDDYKSFDIFYRLFNQNLAAFEAHISSLFFLHLLRKPRVHDCGSPFDVTYIRRWWGWNRLHSSKASCIFTGVASCNNVIK